MPRSARQLSQHSRGYCSKRRGNNCLRLIRVITLFRYSILYVSPKSVTHVLKFGHLAGHFLSAGDVTEPQLIHLS